MGMCSQHMWEFPNGFPANGVAGMIIASIGFPLVVISAVEFHRLRYLSIKTVLSRCIAITETREYLYWFHSFPYMGKTAHYHSSFLQNVVTPITNEKLTNDF